MNSILLPRLLSIAVCALVSLTGCSSLAPIPSSIVQLPTTAPPQPVALPPPLTGAIFQAAGYRALIEDGRARRVGDILTITITENTRSVKAVASSGSKKGEFEVTAPPVLGIFKAFGTTQVTGETNNSFEEKDDASASNTFSGTITVTVTEVLINGNLRVSGEKQLSLDRGTEFVRFSGVVTPGSLGNSNTVASSAVADARVEYRSNSKVDRANVTAMLTRLFLSVLPF
jgi:flagellar L-ring protein FlgH